MLLCFILQRLPLFLVAFYDDTSVFLESTDRIGFGCLVGMVRGVYTLLCEFIGVLNACKYFCAAFPGLLRLAPAAIHRLSRTNDPA